jgi:hypothetical protein
MFCRIRTVIGLLSAVAMFATVALASSAQASVLTATATNCGAPQNAQVFLPWGDPSQYFLAPDGNFAGSAVTWSLSGGAAAVAGGDGYALGGGAPSAQALALPQGSSATTPAICVGIGEPTFRLFAENSGSAASTLRVSVTVVTSLGADVTLPVADISATSTWSPTPVEPIVASLLPLLPGNLTPITLTFTTEGKGGNWEIDDVYVDPWTRGD